MFRPNSYTEREEYQQLYPVKKKSVDVTKGVTLLSFYMVICETRFPRFSKVTKFLVFIQQYAYNIRLYQKRHHLGQSQTEKIHERSTRAHLQSSISLQFFTCRCNTKNSFKNYLPSQSTETAQNIQFQYFFGNYLFSFLQKRSLNMFKVNTHVKYPIQMTI